MEGMRIQCVLLPEVGLPEGNASSLKHTALPRRGHHFPE